MIGGEHALAMGRSLRGVGRDLRGGVLDTLYPPRCAGCGRRGGWVCAACERALPKLGEPWCGRCGVPTRYGRCRCDGLGESLQLVRSVAPLDGWLRPAIHALKYGGEAARADHLGEFLATALPADGAIDGLVPVPLHPARLRWRGFNQSLLLAEAVAARSGLPVRQALRRTRTTDPQVGLDAQERARNVTDAFAVVPGIDLDGARLLLVDDVITTASTLSACAAALAGGGAAFVGALTLAREID